MRVGGTIGRGGVPLVPAPGLTASSLRMLHGVPAVPLIRRCPGPATDGVGIDERGLALEPERVQVGKPRAGARREAAADLLAIRPCRGATVTAALRTPMVLPMRDRAGTSVETVT